ncbi:DMT family transporter [Rhodococcus kronopolitis]|uniref:DMT family transporter n=1 Tax=Rhodococcus kronopolitis TaxID=1460226 RepID=A0ABV9FL45_9NOCA
MMRWILLLGAIVTEVAATLSLRAAVDHPGWYLPVVLGYGAAFVFLAAVLKTQMPVGVAYGIWGASGVSLTAVLAAWLFGDPLTLLMAAGIALVIAGVLTVEVGSQRAAEARAGIGPAITADTTVTGAPQ